MAPVCPICGRTLHYDGDTQSWLNCQKCKSNVAISLAALTIEEGTKGIKGFKKTAKDFWDVLTGKKPW
jgi:tRNA(Ile2) C34 agmatinyltransferase TiaS